MSKSTKIAVDACPERSEAAKPHFEASLATAISIFVPKGWHPWQRESKKQMNHGIAGRFKPKCLGTNASSQLSTQIFLLTPCTLNTKQQPDVTCATPWNIMDTQNDGAQNQNKIKWTLALGHQNEKDRMLQNLPITSNKHLPKTNACGTCRDKTKIP